MGMDQYWYKKMTEEEKTYALLQGKPVEDEKEIAYFRKFYPLNAFLINFYQELDKDGTNNCVELCMNSHIVDAISSWMYHMLGSGSAHRHYLHLRDEVLPILQDNLKAGNQIYYQANW